MSSEKNLIDSPDLIDLKDETKILEPVIDGRLLNPIERISEILFGLIMALSFTCAISVVEADRVEVKEMLIGALGCNLAWGIIDAVMYLINTLSQRGRDLAILNFVRKSQEPEKARRWLAETLSPELSGIINDERLEQIRKDVVAGSSGFKRPGISWTDLKSALGIFLLVFISTIPVTIPFAIIENARTALRISNAVAITLLFLGGWILAIYAGYKKFRTGFILALIGAMMVFVTIELGG